MKKGHSFVATKLRWRNFMSFGDKEMELALTGQDIAVLLGENLDSKSEDARNGVGKAQPLDAKILTPTGFRAMRDIQVDDTILTNKGKPTNVTGATVAEEPQTVFTIELADGRQTEATADHAWTVLTDMKPPKTLNNFFDVDDDPLQWRTLTTREIMDGLASGHLFRLPLFKPEKAEKSGAVEDPYNLGLKLTEHTLFDGPEIPSDLNAPQRYMLLKGMLGYARKGKNCAIPDRCMHVFEADSSIPSLVENMVWSLGGFCYRHGLPNGTQLEIQVQNPNHKHHQDTVRLSSIREGGKKEVKCILIREKDHLYVTDNYIVTHNSTIIDALCYVLFGKTIRGVPNNKLVNKFVPKKPMFVELEFEKGDFQYLVERGERPSVLRLYRQPKGCEDIFKKKAKRKMVYDISRGKTETTEQISELLGYDITLFEYLVANSSKSDPFLKLKPPKQRDVIEKLFGFQIMSLKGKVLSDQRRELRKELAVANTKLETIQASNQRIRVQVAELRRTSEQWDTDHMVAEGRLETEINRLSDIDYDEEIENLKLLADIEVEEARITQLVSTTSRESAQADRMLKMAEQFETAAKQKVDDLTHQIEHMKGGTCPTCSQSWVPEPETLGHLEESLEGLKAELDAKVEGVLKASLAATEAATAYATAAQEKTEFNEMVEAMPTMEFHFNNVDAAIAARGRIQDLRERLETMKAERNPHAASIQGLESQAIQDEDDSEVVALEKIGKHMDFLIKLLTDSDSFIRKSILDQWVPNLNKRIHHYLRATDLPHKVTVNPDLTVSISLHNEDYVYESLSNGEQTRLNIAVNFSFQDIFEFMNYGINILCIDELIDNGLGPAEARLVVGVLKDLNAKKSKSVMLITHREDVAAQADRTFKVCKADDISWIEQTQ